MKEEINPQDTMRAEAFTMWMSSPMPMVTLVKTLNVGRLVKISKKKKLSFNMLLCWCIGRAASHMEEFYLLPEQGRLFRFDRLAVNVIVSNAKDGISSCDIPFCEDLNQFNAEYTRLTRQAARNCKSSFLEDCMVIGTSAMIQTELDCIVNQYTDKFCNPMVMWGKYRKGWFNTSLPVSFQFHHVQMDGGHGARFLEGLQGNIRDLYKYTKNSKRMNALSILYLVLPFPIAFVFHDAEEAAVQHRWMLAHEKKLAKRFPWSRPMVRHLLGLGTKGFVVAAVEELAVILASTAYVFVQGAYAMEIWSALFMAFSLHLLVHIAQAIVVRGYVPGLFTSFLLLPYAWYGVYSIHLAMSLTEMLMWGIVGVIFMAANLMFAHWLGNLGQNRRIDNTNYK